MGSFLSTCCASRQSIQEGVSCYVLPVKQQASYSKVKMRLKDGSVIERFGATSSVCYPSAFWQPVGGFIECVAEDYGRVTLVESEYNQLVILEFFEAMLMPSPVVEQGENGSHDIPFDFMGFVQKTCPALAMRLTDSKVACSSADLWRNIHQVWGYMWGAVHEHRLFVRDSYAKNEVRPLQFSIMLQTAYKDLVRGVECSSNWAGTSREISAIVTQVVSEAFGRIQAKKVLISGNLPEIDRERLSSDMLYEAISFGSLMADAIPQGDVLGCKLVGHELRTAVGLSLINSDTLNMPEIIEKLRPWIEMCYVFEGMDLYNIKFLPVEYAGQDYDNSIGQEYAQFVARVCALEMKGINARFEE